MAEPAQGLQGQGKTKLIFACKLRMAAGEDHPQLAVFNLRVEKQVVDSRLRRGAYGGQLPQNAADRSCRAAAHRGSCSWRCGGPNRMDCQERRGRLPRLQGVDERGLHHVLDEVEIPPAEDAGQNSHQPPRFMAKKMLDQRSDRLQMARRHGFFTFRSLEIQLLRFSLKTTWPSGFAVLVNASSWSLQRNLVNKSVGGGVPCACPAQISGFMVLLLIPASTRTSTLPRP